MERSNRSVLSSCDATVVVIFGVIGVCGAGAGATSSSAALVLLLLF